MAPHDPADAMTLWTAAILIVVVAIVWALTGCATNPCVKPVVDLPEPVLPAVTAGELSCLSDEAYMRLAERDVILKSALLQCREALSELTEQP
jgi:hypothetical protein